MDKTMWLENPIKTVAGKGKVPIDILIEPYDGRKRSKRLWHTSYTIGSSKSCEIYLDDPFVSSQHATFSISTDGTYMLSDLDSKNGSYIDGTKVQNAEIPSGAILRLGRSRIRFPNNEHFPRRSMQNFIYASEPAEQLVTQIDMAAAASFPVLITGETGTGKEVVARAIHERSSRSTAPFIAVNCASLEGDLVNSELFGHRKGAFTGAEKNRLGAILSAHRGTLLLDEFGDLPLATQALLLRALETKEVKSVGSDHCQRSDFRMIAATSVPIANALSEGKLRKDLFYRVAGMWLKIPPLRERRADILAIADNLLLQNNLRLEELARATLQNYDWPGNVRELITVVKRAMDTARTQRRNIILDDDIDFFETPITKEFKSKKVYSIEAIERKLIIEALRRNGGSKTQTARDLGIARSTLFEKLKKMQIV